MYTAKIGDSGIYTLKEPFQALVTPQAVYTCRSIRTINDIIASGELVFEKYYQPLGVVDSQYKQDVQNNICIIGLQAGTGEWIYVPESFILSPPITNGVKYSSIVLGVGLGAIADELNIEGLVEKIKGIVTDTLGIEPNIKAVLVSQPAYIDQDKHLRLEEARKAKIKVTETDYAKAKRLEVENEQKTLKIKELEKWISRRI